MVKKSDYKLYVKYVKASTIFETAEKHTHHKYTVYTQGERASLFWVIMQQVVVISHQCLGTTYRSHPQGSRKVPSSGFK
jgi:hypothetical protein